MNVLFKLTDSSTHINGIIARRSFDIISNFATGSMSRLNCKRFAAERGDDVIWLRIKGVSSATRTCSNYRSPFPCTEKYRVRFDSASIRQQQPPASHHSPKTAASIRWTALRYTNIFSAEARTRKKSFPQVTMDAVNRAKLIKLQIQSSLRWTFLDILIPTVAVQLRITLNWIEWNVGRARKKRTPSAFAKLSNEQRMWRSFRSEPAVISWNLPVISKQ